MDDIIVIRRRARAIGGIVAASVLLSMSLPARAAEGGLAQIEREVTAIVNRVKPSVVSLRVGPAKRQGRTGSGRKTTAKSGVKQKAELLPLVIPGGDSIVLAANNGEAPEAFEFGADAFPFYDQNIFKFNSDAVKFNADAFKFNADAFKFDQKNAFNFNADAFKFNDKNAFKFADKNGVFALAQPSRVGTGFVVERDGLILTTADVVGGSAQVQVQLSDGRELEGKVLGADAATGIAVVRAQGADLPPLRLAEGGPPEPGQWAIIVGNRLDQLGSVWVGTIARSDAVVSGTALQGKLLQINGPVGAGASGAPVLNSKGDVIGVVAATSNPWLRLGQADTKEMEKAAAEIAAQFEKNPEFERQVEELAKAAAELGQKAAAQAQALAEQKQKELEKNPPKTEEEREQREEQLEREMEKLEEELEEKFEAQEERIEAAAERFGEAVERQAELTAELQALSASRDAADKAQRQKLEKELKRLEGEVKRSQEALQRELGRLNELLPQVPGLREFKLDLQPEITKIVAGAQAIAKTAVPAGLAAAPAAAKAATIGSDVVFWHGDSPGQGASTYAIPAATARWAMVQIRDHGRVIHAYLGVRLEDLKPADRERLKAPPEARVRVAEVQPESPAKEAGLLTDDLVLEFEGRRLESAADLQELMRQAKVGERVSLVIWRGGERRTVQATPREKPQQAFKFNPPVIAFPQPAQPPRPPRVVRPPRIVVPPARPPRVMRVLPSGLVRASATGTGRSARVTVEAQDAELEAVFRELSRATGLTFNAEGEAARRRITLKVEGIPVDDLVESLERLYQLRGDRRGNTYTFRVR